MQVEGSQGFPQLNTLKGAKGVGGKAVTALSERPGKVA